jgi:hypothetical protein
MGTIVAGGWSEEALVSRGVLALLLHRELSFVCVIEEHMFIIIY